MNLKGVFLGIHHVLPHMKKANGGVIINTGSMSAVRPRVHAAAYVSSKAGVIMLTKAVALEVAADNIRVNCINPVVTFTTMMKSLSEEDQKAWARRFPSAVWLSLRTWPMRLSTWPRMNRRWSPASVWMWTGDAASRRCVPVPQGNGATEIETEAGRNR